jgi:hypothetical protein
MRQTPESAGGTGIDSLGYDMYMHDIRRERLL